MSAAYLASDLNRVRKLDDLLALLAPFLEGAASPTVAVRAKDATIALNHLKRLQGQARSDDGKAQLVEEAVLTLARRLVNAPDLPSLQAKHVALALNALADRCLGPAARAQDALLQVGRPVPVSWQQGQELVWGGWADQFPSEGDMVAVRRSDGSIRLARVEGRMGGDRSRVLVRVSDAPWSQGAMSRVESADTLARISEPMVDAAAARRAACRVLADELLSREDLLRYCLPQDLATVLWAQARMSLVNRRILKAVLRRALHPVTLRTARPRDLATMLWSLAEMEIRDASAVLAISRSFLLVAGLTVGDARTSAAAAATTERKLLANGQDVSNCLWALARLGLCDDNVAFGLIRAAERLAVTRDPSFTTQAVSNVLWAAAELALTSLPPRKGREWCGADIQRMCENIALAAGSEVARGGGVGSGWRIQGATTTLWALGVLGLGTSPLTRELLELVAARQPSLDDSDFGQLHQYFLSAGLVHERGAAAAAVDPAITAGTRQAAGHEGSHSRDAEAEFADLKRESARVFAGTSLRFQKTSEAQKQVAKVVRDELRFEAAEEVVIPQLGYSVDVMIPKMRVCIEVDGPSHFVTDLGSGLDSRPNGLAPSSCVPSLPPLSGDARG